MGAVYMSLIVSDAPRRKEEIAFGQILTSPDESYGTASKWELHSQGFIEQASSKESLTLSSQRIHWKILSQTPASLGYNAGIVS